MATRIKDGMIPYTGGIGIEITNNHVINVLLRELNNLIHVNENRELYVDLQLDDGIQPDDDFPVGVTTGKILQEDGWQQSGIILNWKTTSGDYVRLIYANDGKLYYDPGTGEWIEIGGSGGGGGGADCNTKTFYLSSTSDLATANEAYDWYKDGKDAILWHDGLMYVFYEENSVSDHYLKFLCTRLRGTARESSGQAFMSANELKLEVDDNTGEIDNIVFTDSYSNNIGFGYLPTNTTVRVPFTPTDDSHPTTKKYVDDGLALKQDKLIAGTNITIAQDGKTISATIPSALIYKGNVTSVADLPSSGQTVGDTYFVEGADAMYSWDGTQWNYVGGTGISLTDYFNMTVNTSDDITEGSVHLFVTQTEKNYWNSKQDQLTAGANIQIDSNNVISATDTKYTGGDGIEITNQNVINNTAKFDPENAGSLGQFLKKTNNGYAWADIPGGGGGTSYTAGDGIDITNNVISATDRFTPTNQGSIGQVLKKSGANTYYWANEGGGGGGGGSVSNTPYGPSWDGVTDVAPSKNAIYDKIESIIAGEGDVKVWNIPQNGFTQEEMQEIMLWCLDGGEYKRSAILKDNTAGNKNLYIYGYHDSIGGVSNYYFYGMWEKQEKNTTSPNGDYTTRYNTLYHISYDGTTFVGERQNTVETAGNYLTVESSGYTRPYMPTAGYQPATKAYVDSRNWVGTLSEYNNLPSIDPDVFYNITSLS